MQAVGKITADLSLKKIIQLRYSFPRFQWLLTTISVISLVYVTSDFWSIVDSRLFPKVIPSAFGIYVELFFGLILLSNIYDIRMLSNSKIKTVVVASFVTLMDTLLVCLIELICLLAIGVLTQDFMQDYIRVISILLLGALPASLGSIVLSSLTARVLKERSKKLLEEVTAVRKAHDVSSRLRKIELKKTKETQEETDKLIKETEES